MLIFKIKKIISFSVFFLLISFIFPILAHAETTVTLSFLGQTPVMTKNEAYIKINVVIDGYTGGTALGKDELIFQVKKISTKPGTSVEVETNVGTGYGDCCLSNYIWDSSKTYNGSSATSYSPGKYKIYAFIKHEGQVKYDGWTLGKFLEIEVTPSPVSVPISDTATQDQENGNYYPLAQLPGLGQTCTKDSSGKTICVQLQSTCKIDPNTSKVVCTPGKGFGDYLNIIIKLFIGICAILAMIMIVMGGIQYMTSELVSSKQAAKETITNAILGLLLALGAYAILYTLNPNLVSIGLENIATANVPQSAHEEIVLNNLANNKVFRRCPDYEKIKKYVAGRYPHCIMQANVQVESNCTTSKVIAHDENVTRAVTPSRGIFIDSGVKFSGATFPKGSNVQNDDGVNAGKAPDPNDINLGLDTRFSHGVGMFGLTFFSNNTTECKKPGKHNILCFHPTDGSNTKIQDIYNNTNDADIIWAVNYAYRGWKACKTPIGVFYYFADNCITTVQKGSTKDITANQKLDLYNQCEEDAKKNP